MDIRTVTPPGFGPDLIDFALILFVIGVVGIAVTWFASHERQDWVGGADVVSMSALVLAGAAWLFASMS
jgi:hypothetical protein